MDPRRILHLVLATLRLVPALLLPALALGSFQGITIGVVIGEAHSLYLGGLAGLVAAPIVAVLVLLFGIHGAAVVSACGLWITLCLAALSRPFAASDPTLLVVTMAGTLVCGLIGWRWGHRVEGYALPTLSRWRNLHWGHLSPLATLREAGIAAEESVAAIVAHTDLAAAPWHLRLAAALLLALTAFDLFLR